MFEPLSGFSRRSTPFLPDDDGCVAVVCSWCEEGASTSFVRISCGDHHTAAVTRDGQVILAGDNDFGELGKVSLLPSTHLYLLSMFLSHRFVFPLLQTCAFFSCLLVSLMSVSPPRLLSVCIRGSFLHKWRCGAYKRLQGNYVKGHVPAPVQALSPRDWRVECLAHSTFVWLPLVD